ncbi:MAG TPA: Wzz/FepE/Etk N-terminal domain-containing protein [Gaiellaceae bacterium]|nr:Wzz/FepE/Etk N-terminal domain-containing protein [Gaiellaceae bacterium]
MGVEPTPTPTDQAHAAAREYVGLLRRRKWLILLVALVVPALAGGLSLLQQKRYQANAEVLLTHQDLAASLLGLPDPNAAVDPTRLAETQASLARSPVVAEWTLRAAGIRDRTAQQFLRQSHVTPRTNEDLLDFAVDDPKPAVAVKLVNAYAHQYPRYQLALANKALTGAKADVDRQIAALQGNSHADAGLYGSLLEKRKELATLAALQTTSALPSRVADSASQVQPRPLRNAVIGLVVGLLLGIALALLRDALDARVRSVEEITERLGVPLLGRLASPPARSSQSFSVMTLAEPHSWQSESFRTLRTNIDFTNLDREAVTIMVTSAVESEGKTTTAANLAVVAAHTGQRVIFVDLDLRRPTVHEFLATPSFPGITDVCLASATLDSALVPVALWPPSADAMNRDGVYDERSLEVLSAGTRPPSIGEFMNARALGEILLELRERADLVLIDTPPLLRVGDALALSASVDAVLLIARFKVVTRPMLADVRRLLERSRTPVLGVVVTGTDPLDGYGYKYSYDQAENRSVSGLSARMRAR